MFANPLYQHSRISFDFPLLIFLSLSCESMLDVAGSRGKEIVAVVLRIYCVLFEKFISTLKSISDIDNLLKFLE